MTISLALHQGQNYVKVYNQGKKKKVLLVILYNMVLSNYIEFHIYI